MIGQRRRKQIRDQAPGKANQAGGKIRHLQLPARLMNPPIDQRHLRFGKAGLSFGR